MTTKEKKRKAAIIAVAYYLEQQAAKDNEAGSDAWTWSGNEIIMDNRARVQRKGHLLK